jgi:sugar lactone lactonase YvrE
MKITFHFVYTLLGIICLSQQANAQLIEIYAGGSKGDYRNAKSTSVNPNTVACHKNGDIYVYDSYDFRIRKISNGIITTFAGTQKKGYTGDDGPATQARIGSMCFIALDSSGNLYLSDTENHRIRKIDANTGVIQTIAGKGVVGYTDSTVLAINAKLSSPGPIILDSLGNIYFSDMGNNQVRKISSTTGLISRVAGNGIAEDFGDLDVTDGLYEPKGLALDSKTNTLYIADAGHDKIKRVNLSTGKIYSFAGTGMDGYAGENDSAFRAVFSGLNGIALDMHGQLFVCDGGNSRIRKINILTTIINTYAGSFPLQNTAESIPATQAKLLYPTDVKIDNLGNLLIVDAGNALLRKVDSNSKIISTIAGNGYSSFDGDSGLANQSLISTPQHLRFDGYGNLIFSDSYNNRIRMVNGADKKLITIAGKGYTVRIDSLLDNVPGPYTYLWNDIGGVTTDINGHVFLSELGRIKKINNQTGIITHYAGKGYPFNQVGFSGDGDSALKALFYHTGNLGADLMGNIYVCDVNNNRIRKINTNTYIISTVAGKGTFGETTENAPALQTALDLGGPMTVDAEGNIYLANMHRIRKIDAKTGLINTIAGNLNNQSGYSGDGDSAKYALLNNVRGLATDASGNLYFSDAWNNRIRRIDALTQKISTVAGNGQNDLEYKLDSALKSSVFFPHSVACDHQGNIYFTYAGNGNIICKIANSLPPIQANVVYNSQTICKNQVPNTLTGTLPNGGSGVYSYLWFRSKKSAISGYTIAPGVNTNLTYSPPSETVTYWYKRLVISGGRCDTSAAVFVRINYPSATTITGAKEVFTSSINTYRIKNASPTSHFNWVVTNGTLLTTQADSVTIEWPNEITTGMIKAIETDSINCIGDTMLFQVTISKQTAINNYALNDHFIQVYPNPVTTSFTLKNNINQPITWHLYHSTGEKLVTATIACNQETNFNCSHLPHGLYLIFAEMGDAIFKQKLVVR